MLALILFLAVIAVTLIAFSPFIAIGFLVADLYDSVWLGVGTAVLALVAMHVGGKALGLIQEALR